MGVRNLGSEQNGRGTLTSADNNVQMRLSKAGNQRRHAPSARISASSLWPDARLLVSY